MSASPMDTRPVHQGRQLHLARQLALLSMLIGLLGSTASQAQASPLASGGPRRALQGFYEPSGVTQLADGRLVLVEDELASPLGLMRLTKTGADFALARHGVTPLRDVLKMGANDLEGVARSADGWIYAITSHSRKANGKRDPRRERLIRFKLGDRGIREIEVINGLRDAIVRTFPRLAEAAKERNVKRDDGLNIEGLAFDEQNGRLLIGLRAPVTHGQATLLAITNTDPMFSRKAAPRFALAIELDLDGGGVRGLGHAPRLGGLLILSQRDTGKKERPSKLWLWNGDPHDQAQRLRIRGVPHLGRAEGVAEVHLRGTEGILVVLDNGDRKKRRPAAYVLAKRAELVLEDKPGQ